MIPQFKANGILADVSSFKDDASFNLDDYIPSTLDLFRDGDQLLGLPFSTPPVVMFYNKTLFDKANLTDPNTLASEGNGPGRPLRNRPKQLLSKTLGAGYMARISSVTGRPGRFYLRTRGLMEAARSMRI